MKIAICSDEPYPIHDLIIDEIIKRRHMVLRFGSFLSKQNESWAKAAKAAALAISQHDCDEGIFLCWTGTGISMTANKIPGVRAALCIDAETARAARIWNHANVLALSNRLLSQDIAKEIMAAWFDTPYDARGQNDVDELHAIDGELRHRKLSK